MAASMQEAEAARRTGQAFSIGSPRRGGLLSTKVSQHYFKEQRAHPSQAEPALDWY